MGFDFSLVDVFTDRPFGGNRLAITYAAEASDPVLLPVRACMTANVTMKFVLIYGVPTSELERAANGITQALRDGALSELPVRRFALSDIAAAHDAVEAGEVGKVVVIPA